jgi:nifR3 family TIM-barrel protein
MAGCTDLAFRRIARRHGCELAFAEMVKDLPAAQGHGRTLRMVRTADWDHPLGMQLVGRDPATMAEAARRLEGLGADVIDVNVGCPVRKIIRDGAGAALLKEPEQVARILEAMVPAVEVPVTVKMRTGFDEEDGSFLKIAGYAEQCGAAAVTVHGRTRRQGFAGRSSFEAIRKVVEAVSIPVFGNGDVRTGEDAARMLRETGCAAVMLGRGTLGNPWIYREIETYLETGTILRPPTIEERARVLSDHFDLLREVHGDYVALLKIRPVIHWFARRDRGSKRLRMAGNLIDSIEGFKAFLELFRRLGPRNS